MLEIRNVTRRFGRKTAVKKVTLTIGRGEMVGVIGRSGAGKSTLLRMINRLIDPSEGEILYGDDVVSRISGAALRRWQRDCDQCPTRAAQSPVHGDEPAEPFLP